DRLRNVLGKYGTLEHGSLAVVLLQSLGRHGVGGGPLLPPFTGPDSRAAQDRVGIDRVDADPILRPFERQAAGEVDFGRLGAAIGGGIGGGGEPVLGSYEDDIAAEPLLLEQPEGSTRDEKVPLGENVHVA